MEIGFSGKGFGHLLVISVISGFIFYSIIFWRAYKKGVDVTKNTFILKNALITAIIFAVIPFWFSNMSIAGKIILTVLALAAGLANFFAVDRMQKFLKDKFIDKKK